MQPENPTASVLRTSSRDIRAAAIYWIRKILHKREHFIISPNEESCFLTIQKVVPLLSARDMEENENHYGYVVRLTLDPDGRVQLIHDLPPEEYEDEDGPPLITEDNVHEWLGTDAHIDLLDAVEDAAGIKTKRQT